MSTDDPVVLRMHFGDGTIREAELTDEQAAELMQGHAITWRSPEVPDISVDEGGMIIEREDARPPAEPGTPP